MSQEKEILGHLKNKPLRPMEALRRYGCLRLAARVHDLRCKGHRVKMRWIQTTDKRFAEYYL